MRSVGRTAGRDAAADDLVEDVSVQDKVDEVAGLSRKVVIESRDKELRPRATVEKMAAS